MDNKSIQELREKKALLEKEVVYLRNLVGLNKKDAGNRQFAETLKAYQQREKEITELLNATHSILKTEEFAITAKQIFDACARSIGARAGYVALLSDDGEENELLFLEDGGMACTVNPDLPMPVRGLRAEAYKTGKVVYNNSFMKSEWVKFMPEGHMALPNVLFSPLNIDGKTVGIIGMACKEKDFDENDARIAKAFGEYAAIALQNSRTLQELKNINSEKDRFFSIISHDLKSPFNALVGFTEVLIDEIKNGNLDNAAEYANIVRNSADQGLNLLNNLLEWSRSQLGRIEFNPEYTNVKDTVLNTVDLFKPQALKKEIEISLVIPEGIKVYADIDMLNTIIRNLVTNAIKFTDQGGKIEVSAVEKEGVVEFSISDNGVGIHPEKIDRLFKVEESFSTEGTHMEKGTGLGLILCRDFVEKHGGNIGVESKKGEGSRFWFTIPRDK